MSSSISSRAGGARPRRSPSLVAFLISNDAQFVTGAHYMVDGGLTAGLL